MNFMPFGQLKSFLKILIEVQYEINYPLFRYALAASSMRLCHISYYFSIKMVNTILSCESFAGRRWRREMYGLTFFAAAPLAAETAAE